MTSQNLGTKRICPKCDAKFYDFGATDPVKCPKCAHSWRDAAKKVAKPKKEVKPVAKPVRKPKDEEMLGEDVDLPEVEDGDDSMDLEPMDDDSVELTSLEEVEEHDEDDEKDPNSDDADDEMFAEMVGDDKLVDDLEDHMEDEDDEEEDEDNEDDDDDDRTKKKRRR
jgi:hypothetical protein